MMPPSLPARPPGSRALAAAGPFSPMLCELRETAYQFRAPFVADSSKFDAAFGPIEPTPHPDAVRRTIDWCRSR